MRRYFIIAALLLAASAQAQPTSVSGDLDDGGSITINGSGMGSYDAPWYYEDFEVPNFTYTDIDTTEEDRDLIFLSENYSMSGSKSLMIDFFSNTGSDGILDYREGRGWALYRFPEDIPLGGKLYISAWIRWDWGVQWDFHPDGYGTGNDNQFKIARIGSNTPSTGATVYSLGSYPPWLRLWGHTEGNNPEAWGPNVSYGFQWVDNVAAAAAVGIPGVSENLSGWNDSFGYAVPVFLDETWCHVEWIIRANTEERASDGLYTTRISRGGETRTNENDGVMVYAADGRLGRQCIGAYMSAGPPPDGFFYHGDPSATHYWDNYYVNNGWQRVVLGDAATYDGCYLREPQPYTSWSAMAIEVGPLVTAGFTEGQIAYLYVVDEDGIPSAPLEVTIGGPGGGEPGAPGRPTGLRATEND